MDTTHAAYESIKVGTLLQTAGGFVVADTLSATPGSRDGRVKPAPFWYDTDGGRHFPNPTDGTLVIGLPGFRVREYGQIPGRMGHVLLNAVPGSPPQGLCPASRNAALTVWSSGKALTGVSCSVCRRMAGLVCTVRR
jgi:hypothetical protein